jgi:hypothetical protein
MPKLGAKVDLAKAKKGPPPVVMAVQPNGYFVLESPAELKQFESDVRSFLGLRVNASGLSGTGTESCSAGCSDDCDMA